MAMFDTIPVTAFEAISSIALSLTVIALTLVLFAWWWLNTTTFYLPLGDYDDADNQKDQAEGRVKLETTWKYFKALLRRLFDLDPWYWTRYSGFECRISLIYSIQLFVVSEGDDLCPGSVRYRQLAAVWHIVHASLLDAK